MRIGLVCPYNFNYPGGVQQRVLALFKEFKKLKHEVKILTPKTKKFLPQKQKTPFFPKI
jgi:phosphatidylinositol alpha-mannosyltransferase